ncbi:hypothetical protein C8R46DRAFT_1228001 [Mycena filopes]|nr:hypothetical protein C8R46DRAFT_1228001 [Mycena filopes]
MRQGRYRIRLDGHRWFPNSTLFCARAVKNNGPAFATSPPTPSTCKPSTNEYNPDAVVKFSCLQLAAKRYVFTLKWVDRQANRAPQKDAERQSQRATRSTGPAIPVPPSPYKSRSGRKKKKLEVVDEIDDATDPPRAAPKVSRSKKPPAEKREDSPVQPGDAAAPENLAPAADTEQDTIPQESPPHPPAPMPQVPRPRHIPIPKARLTLKPAPTRDGAAPSLNTAREDPFSLADRRSGSRKEHIHTELTNIYNTLEQNKLSSDTPPASNPFMTKLNAKLEEQKEQSASGASLTKFFTQRDAVRRDAARGDTARARSRSRGRARESRFRSWTESKLAAPVDTRNEETAMTDFVNDGDIVDDAPLATHNEDDALFDHADDDITLEEFDDLDINGYVEPSDNDAMDVDGQTKSSPPSPRRHSAAPRSRTSPAGEARSPRAHSADAAPPPTPQRALPQQPPQYSRPQSLPPSPSRAGPSSRRSASVPRSSPAAPRSPLPPSSPNATDNEDEQEPEDDDEIMGSDDGSDSFSETERKAQRDKDRRRANGALVEDSDDGDEEDEAAFDAAVAAEKGGPRKPSKKSMGKRKEVDAPAKKKKEKKTKEKKTTVVVEEADASGADNDGELKKKKKKKKKKTTVVEEADAADLAFEAVMDGNGEDETDDDDDCPTAAKRGPIPQSTKDSVAQAYKEFTAKIADIAQATGTAPKILHRIAGTNIKHSRAASAWNVWQRRYAEMNPNNGRYSTADYNALSRQAYVEACGPVPPNKSAEVFAHIPELAEFRDRLRENAVLALRADNKLKSNIQQDINPIIQTINVLQQTYAVHIHGYVIDTNGDASFMFGAGADFKEMRSSHLVTVGHTIKEQEHIYGEIERRKRGRPTTAAVPLLAGDGSRDALRKRFSRIMADQLHAFLFDAGLAKAGHKMSWNGKLLDLFFQSKCRLINHAAALLPKSLIGSNTFALKDITAVAFKTFLPGLEKGNGGRNPVDVTTGALDLPHAAAKFELPHIAASLDLPHVAASIELIHITASLDPIAAAPNHGHGALAPGIVGTLDLVATAALEAVLQRQTVTRLAPTVNPKPDQRKRARSPHDDRAAATKTSDGQPPQKKQARAALPAPNVVIPRIFRVRFIIRRPDGDELGPIFEATQFVGAQIPTRADEVTYYEEPPESKKWRRIPQGTTPALIYDYDKERYMRAVESMAL